MARVVGSEMNSQEPEKAAAFYSNVFGWQVDEPRWHYRLLPQERIDQKKSMEE